MRARALVAALTFAATLPLADATAACPGVQRSGRWSTIAPPGGADSSSLAVAFGARGKGEALYVAAGRTIQRSTDGGCTWHAAVSLDEQAARTMTSPVAAFQLVTTAPGPGGNHTVYALALDSFVSVVVTMPAVMAVSTDSGATWTFRSMAPADLAGDYPRCTNAGWSSLRAGSDPSTAYLYCHILSFGEFLLLTPHLMCSSAYYVTHDAAKTWQPIVPRIGDPTRISTTNIESCLPLGEPLPDPARPKVLWDLRTDTVFRSADEGRTFTQFSKAPKPMNAAWYDVTSVRGKPAVVIWDAMRISVGTGGTAQPLAPFPLKSKELGAIVKAVFVPGTTDVLVTYVDGAKAARLFRYVAARKAWVEQPRPPLVDKKPAWADSGTTAVFSNAVSGEVYVGVGPAGRILRMTR